MTPRPKPPTGSSAEPAFQDLRRLRPTEYILKEEVVFRRREVAITASGFIKLIKVFVDWIQSFAALE